MPSKADKLNLFKMPPKADGNIFKIPSKADNSNLFKMHAIKS